jgi:hypothetical protein
VAGEIALMSPESDAARAQSYFDRALALAGAQQAKSWKLRAAMNMARLWRDQGKPKQGLRRALSPTFRAGGMVFFIPWRVGAEESGAAQFGFGGAMLLDLLGPMVRPPAAPSISILV